jgi:hypothetical protein
VSFDAQAGLMLLACALYVFDALLLLRPDELVLTEGRSGAWHPRFGANGWKLRGLEPLLPNLLAPWRPMVRVHWAFEEGLAVTDTGPPLPTLRSGPRVATTVLLLLVFIALPVGLFVYPVTSFVLAVVALIYATCVAIVTLLFFEWRRLGLRRSEFWKLSVEYIACPPFAINAVRKTSLMTPIRRGLARAPASRSDAAAWLDRQVEIRVREQMDSEPEGSERMGRLKGLAQSLAQRQVQ